MEIFELVPACQPLSSREEKEIRNRFLVRERIEPHSERQS